MLPVAAGNVGGYFNFAHLNGCQLNVGETTEFEIDTLQGLRTISIQNSTAGAILNVAAPKNDWDGGLHITEISVSSNDSSCSHVFYDEDLRENVNLKVVSVEDGLDFEEI